MLFNILAFLIALIYTNIGEWFFHRFVLHGLGRHRESFFAYHWYEHHMACRKVTMFDPAYGRWPTSWNAQAKEALVLALILIIHFPLLFVAPGFAAGFCFSIAFYYYRHRKAHLDPDWAFRHLRWHYDHHQADKISSANWCITWPWFDWLVGSRVKKP